MKTLINELRDFCLFVRGDSTVKNFTKRFYRKAPNGQTVSFEFEIRWETNVIDTGLFSSNVSGYFIHILDAPALNETLWMPHQFHIINRNPSDPYICWSEPIKNFEQANAVMLSWVNNYMKEIKNGGK